MKFSLSYWYPWSCLVLDCIDSFHFPIGILGQAGVMLRFLIFALFLTFINFTGKISALVSTAVKHVKF